MNSSAKRFCVAPMMDWTDRHCRYFHRVLSKQALLYTEMITTGALLYGNALRALKHDPFEYPLAIQLGGHDAYDLAFCAVLAEDHGYHEVNLNVGCPSGRVQNGRIGACLMAEPETVAMAVKAMKDSVSIPVTVKHRLGIDGHESWQEFLDFVGIVSEAGCDTCIVHARIAVLGGLSPKENRDIPELKPDWVYELKNHFPELNIFINGGIRTFEEIDHHLENVDGVMIGREAYLNPYMLSKVDRKIFGSKKSLKTRLEVIEEMIPYIECELMKGTRLSDMTKHLLGLYRGLPQSRLFRKHISEHARKPGSGVDVLLEGLKYVEDL